MQRQGDGYDIALAGAEGVAPGSLDVSDVEAFERPFDGGLVADWLDLWK